MSNRPTFRTQLCDILDIEYPIMLAGMGSMGKATPPALVAAVSNAGGMGVIGGAGLDLHSTLAKTLLDKSKSYFFRQKLEMERHCIEGGPIDPVISQIEEMIYRRTNMNELIKSSI